ncbi:uncharacterized protein B0H18DRAFT_1213139 [Fomitopsis serialis]|uniref:uncharacterized protein n=1 Tax=Fomitopsis serialis TaxID=139415 RepID=UPI002008337F|nr:uncharacterized protein B0H18DRAFT_1213139 [Neoantrodia serialis]KAH9921153.1 hypothetical protein B0H18DRAFT_1213139 [Neoantrodia serialis]
MRSPRTFAFRLYVGDARSAINISMSHPNAIGTRQRAFCSSAEAPCQCQVTTDEHAGRQGDGSSPRASGRANQLLRAQGPSIRGRVRKYRRMGLPIGGDGHSAAPDCRRRAAHAPALASDPARCPHHCHVHVPPPARVDRRALVVKASVAARRRPPLDARSRADRAVHAQAPAKARQDKFVESVAQRKERVEFLRRREWTRRIAEWIDSAAGADAKVRAPHRAVMRDASADAHTPQALPPITYSRRRDYEDAPPPAQPAPYRYPSHPHDEPESMEPYIIYTASPRSHPAPALPSSYTPPPAYPARPPALNMQGAPMRQRSAAELRSRHSSLSSISEEEEPAPAPCF